MVAFVTVPNLGADFDLSDTTNKKIKIVRASDSVDGVVTIQNAAAHATVANRSDDSKAVTAAYVKAALDSAADKAISGLASYDATTNIATYNYADGSTLTVDYTALINDAVAEAAVADASTTVKGKVELATAAEAAAGTDTVRAVTPAGLKAYVDANGTSVSPASETAAGIVELATTAEVTAGTSTSTVATPAGVAAAIAASVPDASETARGIVELATTAEASAGTDTERAVTPAGLKATLDAQTLPSGTFDVEDAFGTTLATALT